MGDPPTETVRYQQTGRVAVLGFDSPPANALSTELIGGLDAALDRAIDQSAAVVVLTSVVPGFFVAGADIKLMEAGDVDVFTAYLRGVRGTIERLCDAPFLSIAAIDGHALGGGLELAAACSVRVAGPGARLGVPEVKLGLLPGAGGTQRLPRLIGRTAALDLTMSGRSVDAAEAVALGLVDRVVDDPTGEAEEWAHELAQGPIEAYREIVRCIDAAVPGLDDGMTVEFDAVARLFDSPDGREGLQAFIEKRRPTFGQGPTRNGEST
jgi:enoyl-CoA hydratase/carnithine racemase